MLKVLCIIAFFLLPQQVKQKTIITPEMLRDWVTYLSSDEMKGRNNGSPQMNAAASWIAARYNEDGLWQFSSLKDYIQNYSYKSRHGEINERNVIGYIEGSDPSLKNEYIVVSAHFDHIGMNPGAVDSVFNGADDNAAGTATLLGIARYIKESGRKPGRSLIFAAFSGEEHGMRGSRYFVSNCPVPLKSIYAEINYEMTGHSELLGKNNYYMTGCPYSNLDDLIKEYENGSEFCLVDTINISNELFYASDNIAFSRLSSNTGITSGIPGGTFATSTMARYLHQTSDEAGLFDFENMSALVNHFSEIVLKLSREKRLVSWTDPKWKRP